MEDDTPPDGKEIFGMMWRACSNLRPYFNGGLFLQRRMLASSLRSILWQVFQLPVSPDPRQFVHQARDIEKMEEIGPH